MSLAHLLLSYDRGVAQGDVHPAADSPAERLIAEAIESLRRGDTAGARHLSSRASEIAPATPGTRFLAGLAALLCYDFDQALSHLGRAVGLAPPWGPWARDLQIAIADAAVWPLDLCAIARDCIAGGQPQVGQSLLRRVSAEAAPHVALAAARTAMDAVSVHTVEACAALAEAAGRAGDAAEAERAALLIAGQEADDQTLAAVASALIEAGALDAAEHVLERALKEGRGHEVCLVRAAELALWRGDPGKARDFAQRIPGLGSSASGPALRVLGIVAWRQGDVAGARRLLQEALDAKPDEVESLLWLGHILVMGGEQSRGEALLKQATAGSRSYLFQASLLSLLHEFTRRRTRAQRYPWPVSWISLHFPGALRKYRRGLAQHVLWRLPVVLPGAERALRLGGVAEVESTLRAATERLGNNLSSRTTLLESGRLRRVRLPDPRQESFTVLHSIRVVPAAEVQAQLEALVRRYPDSALPESYLGELHLWLGNVDAARSHLRGATRITWRARWAYIGLSACALLENEPREALRVLRLGVRRMWNTTGPAVYAYRGEALRQLGRLDEAASEIRRSLEFAPRRVSAWINLALVHGARGDTGALADCFTKIRSNVSGLVSDAASEEGIDAWRADGTLPTPQDLVRLLDRMLIMVRGNRSSALVTYFRSDGRLRTTVPLATSLDGLRVRAWRLLDRIEPALRDSRPFSSETWDRMPSAPAHAIASG